MLMCVSDVLDIKKTQKKTFGPPLIKAGIGTRENSVAELC